MADVTKTVEVLFNARDNLSSKMGKIGSSVTGIASPIANVTTSILKFEAAAAGAAAAFLGLSLKLAGDFQVNLASIGTLSDATGQQMDALGGDILNFASTSTSSLDQLAKSTFDAQSAGIAFEDSIKTLAIAEQLGVAGHTDNASAMKLLTGTMNGMGLEASDLGSIADTMFATMQGGVTTIAEMSNTFSLITPAAKAAGISLDEVGAAFSTVTAVTGNSSIAATQLKALFNELSKPTEKLTAAFKSQGVAVDSAAFGTLDLAGKMGLLLEATGGSAEKTKLLFSSLEAGSAGFIIAQNGLSKYNAELDRQANKNGLVQASYEKLIGTLNNQTTIALNAATVALTQFGTPMLDSFSSVAAGVAAIFQTLGVEISDGALSDITDQINIWANALGANLQGVAAALPKAFEGMDFTPLLEALGNVGTSLGSVFDGLDLTKPDDLAQAVNSVIKVMAGFVDATAGVFSVLADLAVAIASGAKAWGDFDRETQTLIGTLGGVAIAISAVAPALMILSSAVGVSNKGLLKMAGSSSKIISALGKAGLVGAFAAAGYAAGTFTEKYLMSDSSKNAIQDFIGWIDRLTGGLISSEAAAKAYNQTPIVFDDVTQAALDNADAILASAAAMRAAIAASTDAGISTEDYASAMQKVSDSATGAATSQEDMKSAASRLKAQLDAGTISQTDYNAGLKAWGIFADGVASSTATATREIVGYMTAADGTKTAIYQTVQAHDAAKESTDKATEALKAGSLEWAKLNQQTGVKIFEIQATIDIARMDNVTQRIQAAFGSIDNTISSTGDLLGTLFGELTGASSSQDRIAITQQIAIENQRRGRAMQQQARLVEKQIAAADSIIRQGNTPATLEVHANNMVPEIEAFMWKILERLQIKAASSKLEYLQGLATGATAP